MFDIATTTHLGLSYYNYLMQPKLCKTFDGRLRALSKLHELQPFNESVVNLINALDLIIHKVNLWSGLTPQASIYKCSYNIYKTGHIYLQHTYLQLCLNWDIKRLSWAVVVWLSWQSGRFRYQRSVVQIQSSAKIYLY